MVVRRSPARHALIPLSEPNTSHRLSGDHASGVSKRFVSGPAARWTSTPATASRSTTITVTRPSAAVLNSGSASHLPSGEKAAAGCPKRPLTGWPPGGSATRSWSGSSTVPRTTAHVRSQPHCNHASSTPLLAIASPRATSDVEPSPAMREIAPGAVTRSSSSVPTNGVATAGISTWSRISPSRLRRDAVPLTPCPRLLNSHTESSSNVVIVRWLRANVWRRRLSISCSTLLSVPKMMRSPNVHSSPVAAGVPPGGSRSRRTRPIATSAVHSPR